MSFYSDYIRDASVGNHIQIIALVHAYLQYGSCGYERTVDYSQIVWC